MQEQLSELATQMGDGPFLALMAVVSLLLSLVLIPQTTDLMVNSAAGLAGKYLGRQHRTLVINSSTNNPELVTMLAAFCFGKVGGIGTPLGSNFANIYLMFGVALGWVLLTMRVRNPAAFRDLCALLAKERRLMAWHLAMSGLMFCAASLAFRELTGQFPFGSGTAESAQAMDGVANPDHFELTSVRLLSGAAICGIGIAFFLWRDALLRRKRPELYHEIDDSEHVASFLRFGAGTLGLIVGCYAINLIFVVITDDVYKVALTNMLGKSVFAIAHFFVGALVTSLPELTVAIKNYRRVASADLNTAFASATASNMSNLAIAGIGCLLAIVLL